MYLVPEYAYTRHPCRLVSTGHRSLNNISPGKVAAFAFNSKLISRVMNRGGLAKNIASSSNDVHIL